VVGRQAAHELFGVAHQCREGALDPEKIVEVERLRHLHGHEAAGTAARIPAKGGETLEEIGRRRSPGQPLEQPGSQLQRALREPERAFDRLAQSFPSGHGRAL
jgi:hypothetical protein